MHPPDAEITHVSDTALMVAACRAVETESPDGFVRDPFAARLAGDRGMAILRALPRPEMMRFGIGVRSRLMDELLLEALAAEPIATVVCLGCGLDTRPWRLDLSPELRWLEVDFADMLNYKDSLMSAERPRCHRERLTADLNDVAQRRSVYSAIGPATALMVTEGLLMYLPAGTVNALADEAWRQSGIAHWMSDIMTTAFAQMLKLDTVRSIANVQASDFLQGEQILDCLTGHGWAAAGRRSYLTDMAFAKERGERITESRGPEATGTAGRIRRSDGRALVCAQVRVVPLGLTPARLASPLTARLLSRIVTSMHARLLVPFLAFASALLAQPAAPQIPSTVVAERDVEYSAVGGRQLLDIILPREASHSPRPAVLLVHGGGFRAGTKESYIPLAIKLAEHGYVAATATYRLAPRNQFPAAVQDVKAAVRFLRANAAKYNIDSNHIGALGGSAGGHLVLMLGLTAGVEEFEGSGPNRDQSSAVQCVVDEYGPTDFTESYSKSVDAAEVLPKFLGGDLDHERLAHIRSSPLNWVTPNAAPTLAIHGSADTYVAYEQSLWIIERLIAAGVPAELETISGSGHGFKGADALRADERALAWFEKYLKPKPVHHTLLISDHGPNGEIAEIEWPSAKVLWTKPNDHGHDVQALPNGHVLFTINPQKKVVELDGDHKEVWTYSEGLEHPIAAQRLANGNTLIGDAKLGKVIEVTADKKIVWKYESPDLANMRSRNAHRTEQGTTLIAVEAEGKLIEVDQAGSIVWQWQAPNGKNRRLYMGRRLANGNTVMSLSDPGELVEVDHAGKTIRSIGGTDPSIQMGWTSGFTFLPEGGILINDYTGRRIIEVDAKGKVANEWRTGSRTIASIDLVR